MTKKVQPKKERHAAVVSILKLAQAELQVKLDRVASLKEDLAALEAECKELENAKQALLVEMDKSAKRMVRAEKLVGLLEEEGIRW